MLNFDRPTSQKRDVGLPQWLLFQTWATRHRIDIPGPQMRGTGGTLRLVWKHHRDRGHPPMLDSGKPTSQKRDVGHPPLLPIQIWATRRGCRRKPEKKQAAPKSGLRLDHCARRYHFNIHPSFVRSMDGQTFSIPDEPSEYGHQDSRYT